MAPISIFFWAATVNALSLWGVFLLAALTESGHCDDALPYREIGHWLVASSALSALVVLFLFAYEIGLRVRRWHMTRQYQGIWSDE